MNRDIQMADTVTTQTISDTSGIKYVVKMTNVSDGTGETLVTKVDASALTFMTEDGSRKLSKIWYSVNINQQWKFIGQALQTLQPLF